MIINMVGILAVIALIGLVANTVENYKSRMKSQISFKESMDLVELPVVTFYNNNNKKVNFLLDTGSNISYINSSILNLLDHKMEDKTGDTIGMEGNKVSQQFCTMTVAYKDQVFTEEFSIASLDGSFDIVRQESGVQLHGILGSKFFEKYKYVLDFKDLIAYIK